MNCLFKMENYLHAAEIVESAVFRCGGGDAVGGAEFRNWLALAAVLRLDDKLRRFYSHSTNGGDRHSNLTEICFLKFGNYFRN